MTKPLTPPTPSARPVASAEHRHRLLAAFAALNALSAWFGVVGLVGGGLSFGEELDQRLPFDSLVLAGFALAVVVALPSTVLAVLAWRGDPRTAAAATGLGVLLIGWIVVQLLFLQSFSFFHPLYAAIGVAFLVAGRRMARRPGTPDRPAGRPASRSRQKPQKRHEGNMPETRRP